MENELRKIAEQLQELTAAIREQNEVIQAQYNLLDACVYMPDRPCDGPPRFTIESI